MSRPDVTLRRGDGQEVAKRRRDVPLDEQTLSADGNKVAVAPIGFISQLLPPADLRAAVRCVVGAFHSEQSGGLVRGEVSWGVLIAVGRAGNSSCVGIYGKKCEAA